MSSLVHILTCLFRYVVIAPLRILCWRFLASCVLQIYIYIEWAARHQTTLNYIAYQHIQYCHWLLVNNKVIPLITKILP